MTPLLSMAGSGIYLSPVVSKAAHARPRASMRSMPRFSLSGKQNHGQTALPLVRTHATPERERRVEYVVSTRPDRLEGDRRASDVCGVPEKET